MVASAALALASAVVAALWVSDARSGVAGAAGR